MHEYHLAQKYTYAVVDDQIKVAAQLKQPFLWFVTKDQLSSEITITLQDVR